MKKIQNIIVVYDYAYVNGGAAKVAIQSAISLSEAGYTVYYYAAVGPVCDELMQSNVKVSCLGIKDINTDNPLKVLWNGIWNFEVEKDFDEFLSKFSINSTIIHFHGWTKALSVAPIKVADKKRFHIAITLHDYFAVCPNGGFYNYQENKLCKYKAMSLKCLACNCDKRSYFQKWWRCVRQSVQDFYVKRNENIHYISISGVNENLIRPYVKSEKFYRVDNPVEMSMNKKRNAEKEDYFLYVGRVSEEKGAELFCEAITQLKKSDVTARGIILGDGPLYEQLKAKYANVEFTGWLPSEEVQTYMESARCLVFPSKCYEGAPLTIIEAMSVGLPCIVSDCTSATEVIVDGYNGFVFRSNDVNILVNKMQSAMEDAQLDAVINRIETSMDFEHYTLAAYAKRLLVAFHNFFDK